MGTNGNGSGYTGNGALPPELRGGEPTVPEPFDGDWRTLPVGAIWADSFGQKWRRMPKGRLRVGGSSPPEKVGRPAIIRQVSRAYLSELLDRAREIAADKRSTRDQVLKALDLLHRVGGMQSVALLNADGEDVTLPPIAVALYAPPPAISPVSSAEDATDATLLGEGDGA